ncbi:hypothetical protein [Gloeothece verrucosa]|uniref:Uncharacterized protein n=1 Tax=Gloeothece verrucosa (strain PCC 7822) TaxID=497965 RepID=E0UMF5_GLOV7|nr:hypothetical protein [Gloeothece verrucosa]ADN18135.1 hypothetical protein Cyan7822_6344 [Gloeothece verrucosa PCC 7822]
MTIIVTLLIMEESAEQILATVGFSDGSAIEVKYILTSELELGLTLKEMIAKVIQKKEHFEVAKTQKASQKSEDKTQKNSKANLTQDVTNSTQLNLF